MAELETKIFNISGQPFNINSPKQVAEILFDKLELKGKKKKSRSTSAEVLAPILAVFGEYMLGVFQVEKSPTVIVASQYHMTAATTVAAVRTCLGIVFHS